MGEKTQKDDGLSSMPYARELNDLEMIELQLSEKLKDSSQRAWELLKRHSIEDIIKTKLFEKMAEPVDYLLQLRDMPYVTDASSHKDIYLQSAIPRTEYTDEIINHIRNTSKKLQEYKANFIPLPQLDYISELYGVFMGIRDRAEIMDMYRNGEIGSQVEKQNLLALNESMDDALRMGDMEDRDDPRIMFPNITFYELQRIKPLTPETVLFGHMDSWMLIRDRADLAKKSVYKMMVLMNKEDPRYVSYPYALHEIVNLFQTETEERLAYEKSEKSRVP
jgi:hypothetical protein